MLSKNLDNSKKLKVVVCIQARMGSKRLKNKALLKIEGKTMIEQIFKRLKSAKEVDDIVLATSKESDNDILEKHSKEISLKSFRGEEHDLISRFYQLAQKFEADAIVRITGDCPLVCPELLDKMILVFRQTKEQFDLVTNISPPSFPDGADIEILTFNALVKLDKQVNDIKHREWLTYYVMENPEQFNIYNLKNDTDLSQMRWTVDWPEDFEFVSAVFKELDRENQVFTMKDILSLLKRRPEIAEINAMRKDNTIIDNIRSVEYHSKISDKTINYKNLRATRAEP